MGSIVKGVGDLVLGKKDPGQAAQTIDMTTPEQAAAQANLMGKFQGIANQDYGQLAQNETNKQEAQIRQNMQDQQSRAQQMVAQRGLGGTSIGLNAVLAPGQNLSNDIGAVRANRLGLENDMKMKGLGFAANGMGNIWQQQGANKIYQPGQASQGRQGGLLAPALGIAGGILGASAGPGGIAAGSQSGMGLGKALQQF